MASYAGTDLGVVEACNTSAAPKERQVNAYPGVNGLQLLDHGSRGGMTALRGHLIASSKANLATLVDTFRGYQLAGGKASLVDTYGTTWTGVILTQFRPTGRFYAMPGGYFCQAYEAEFLHPDV